MKEYEYVLLNGMKVLLELLKPWDNTDWIICSDYYLTFLGEAETLKIIFVSFFSVVNTSTNRFPMKYLSEIELFYRGVIYVVVSKDENGLPSLFFM